MRAAWMTAALLVPCGQVAAESAPSRGSYDSRIREVIYNPQDVVRVVGNYGYSTRITFGEDETVTNIALGDSLAWTVWPVGRHVFVKPREDKAATNMTVLTDRREYEFALLAPTQPHAQDLTFAVRFRYPDEEARKRDAAASKLRQQTALAQASPPRNWNYWGCGHKTLWPSQIYDDGRFTYLQFPGAQEIPGVFVINADGTESLANAHMHGDQYVVQMTAPQLILRKGRSIACMQNRSWNPRGIATVTGTASPQVRRRLLDDAPIEVNLPAPPSPPASAAQLQLEQIEKVQQAELEGKQP